jgi:hypothetical protein
MHSDATRISTSEKLRQNAQHRRNRAACAHSPPARRVKLPGHLQARLSAARIIRCSPRRMYSALELRMPAPLPLLKFFPTIATLAGIPATNCQATDPGGKTKNSFLILPPQKFALSLVTLCQNVTLLYHTYTCTDREHSRSDL